LVNICEKKQKHKPCGPKFQIFGVNHNKTLYLLPNFFLNTTRRVGLDEWLDHNMSVMSHYSAF